MVAGAQVRRNDKASIKYRHNPHEDGSFELGDFGPGVHDPSSSNNCKQNVERSEATPPVIVSTGDLIAAAGQLWKFATSPPFLHYKTVSEQNTVELQKGKTLFYPAEEDKFTASTSYASLDISDNQKISIDDSLMVKLPMNLDCLNAARKASPLGGCPGCWKYSPLGCRPHVHADIPVQSCKGIGFSGVAALRDSYGWVREVRHAGLKYLMNSTRIESKITSVDYFTDRGYSDTSITEDLETPSDANPSIMENNPIIKPLCSCSLLDPVQDVKVSTSLIPNLQEGSCVSSSGSGISPCAERHSNIEDDLHESKSCHQRENVIDKKSEATICSENPNKPQYVVAKQEHAFAGACAGIFVSLCLHPVDTVKTVIQSCRTDQRSIHYVAQSIISERGLCGLYRGISSNIASSAPISAIYTFTYESVKGFLLPYLAKEYHSLGHCIAGGSASIATSFIFTPSERIKQQMQVGSHFHSSWNALFGIIKKGGFFSLYTGWGAVLCRNIPHSVVKFYMYESLKQLMSSPSESNAQPSTILTLVCGGLAGSTASLFTTPFDVVKTRLQTQIPGTVSRYDGVLNTLKVIARREGLKGLYRGLTPRLAMYMTQGALFFASYESFKRLFSLNAIPAQGQNNPAQQHPKGDCRDSFSKS